MSKKFAISIASILAVSGHFSVANAADLSGRLYTPDDNPAGYAQPVKTNWSGLWLGAVGGLTFFNTEFDHDFAPPESERVNIQHLNIDGLGADGFFGEVQAGYDHQINNRFVVGVFGGLNLSDAEFSASYSERDDLYTVSTDYDYGGVIGARLGLLKGQDTMFYIAGGYAFAQLGDTKVNFDGEADSIDGPDLDGWFGEVGLEHRLTNALSLTVTGRYTDYGSETLWSNDSEFCPQEIEIDPEQLAVMVGLKAKLGGF